MHLFVDNRPDVGTRALGSLYGVLETAPAGPDIDYAFEGEAEVVVDPRQGNDFDPWWAIARGCDGLAEYYRAAVAKRFGIRLLKPSFDAHVSVVAGERPAENEGAWAEPHGRHVRFRHTHEVFTNGYFWWLRVHSPDLDAIRARFGLHPAGARGPDGRLVGKDPFHLTVGKTHPSDITRL